MDRNPKNEDKLFIRGIDLKVAIEWFDAVEVPAHELPAKVTSEGNYGGYLGFR